MRYYFLLNTDKSTMIISELNQLPTPKPFFDFKSKDKLTELSQVPNSNTDNTPVPIFRTIWALETIIQEDLDLLGRCKQNSEWWWVADDLITQRLQWFCSQPDSVTVGKTKEELDNLFNSENL